MHLLYLNLPWMLDETEYNCSGRSLSEWKSRGSINEIQGLYFTVSGTVFVIIYGLCLIGMVRGSLLEIPCYCIMFFNGFIDIIDIIFGSFFTAYFHYNGTVFCSSPALSWFVGHVTWCAWCGGTFNCVVLALNRVVEMIPSASFLRFLFKTTTLWIWMMLCIMYMTLQPFIHRAHPYNTVVSTFAQSPIITDDPVQEAADYAVMLVPIQNVTIVIMLVALYSILCIHIVTMPHFAKGAHYKFQVTLFVQASLICLTTATTSFLYVLLGFLSLSRNLIITMMVIWQLSHGLHGIIYFCFNQKIRAEVLRLFNRRRLPVTTAVSFQRTRASEG